MTLLLPERYSFPSTARRIRAARRLCVKTIPAVLQPSLSNGAVGEVSKRTPTSRPRGMKLPTGTESHITLDNLVCIKDLGFNNKAKLLNCMPSTGRIAVRAVRSFQHDATAMSQLPVLEFFGYIRERCRRTAGVRRRKTISFSFPAVRHLF